MRTCKKACVIAQGIKVIESWPSTLLKVLLLPARGHGARRLGAMQWQQHAPVRASQQPQ